MTGSSDGADGSGKTRIALRLDAETLQRLKALGPDWQERLNEILREALDDGSLGEDEL